MTWDDYYDKINDWAVSTAVNKIASLEDMGAPEEIVDALNIIAFEDEKGAARLLNKALQHGVKFSGENLTEIVDLCAEESFKKALYQSADAFTAQDLEDLYGCVDDELIVELAKRYRLSAPADLCEDQDEEASEQQDLEYEIQDAIDAADYALDCLVQAQSAMNDSNTASFLDIMNKGFFTSLMKYSVLSESDVEMQQAQNAIDRLNAELRVLQKNKSVKLKYDRLATAIELWMDDGLLDAMTHLQINKAQKRISRAITQVDRIRCELMRCL